MADGIPGVTETLDNVTVNTSKLTTGSSDIAKNSEYVGNAVNDTILESPYRAQQIDFDSKLPCTPPDPQNPLLWNLFTSPRPEKSFVSPTYSRSSERSTGTLQGTLTSPVLQGRVTGGQLDLPCDIGQKQPVTVDCTVVDNSGNVSETLGQPYCSSRFVDIASQNEPYTENAENNISKKLQQTCLISEVPRFCNGGILNNSNAQNETYSAVKVDVNCILDTSKSVTGSSGNCDLMQNSFVEEMNLPLGEQSKLCQIESYYSSSQEDWELALNGAAHRQCQTSTCQTFSQNRFSPPVDFSALASQRFCNYTSLNNSKMPVVANNSQMPVVANNSQMPVVTNSSQMPVVANNSQMPVVVNNSQMPIFTNNSQLPVVTTACVDSRLVSYKNCQVSSAVEPLNKIHNSLRTVTEIEKVKTQTNVAADIHHLGLIRHNTVEYATQRSQVSTSPNVETENGCYHSYISGKIVDGLSGSQTCFQPTAGYCMNSETRHVLDDMKSESHGMLNNSNNNTNNTLDNTVKDRNTVIVNDSLTSEGMNSSETDTSSIVNQTVSETEKWLDHYRGTSEKQTVNDAKNYTGFLDMQIFGNVIQEGANVKTKSSLSDFLKKGGSKLRPEKTLPPTKKPVRVYKTANFVKPVLVSGPSLYTFTSSSDYQLVYENNDLQPYTSSQVRDGTMNLVNNMLEKTSSGQVFEIKYCNCPLSADGSDVPVEQVFTHKGQMYQLPDANILRIGKFEFYAFLKEGIYYIPLGNFNRMVGKEVRNMFASVIDAKSLKVLLTPDEVCLLEQKCNRYYDNANKYLLDLGTIRETCLDLLKMYPDDTTLKMLAFSIPCRRNFGSQMRCSKCGLAKRCQDSDEKYIPLSQTLDAAAKIGATIGKLQVGDDVFISFQLSSKTYLSFKDIVKHKVLSLRNLQVGMKKIKSKAIKAPKEIEAYFFANSCSVDHTLWIDTVTLRCLACMMSSRKSNLKLKGKISQGEFSYEPAYNLLCEDTSKLEKVFAITSKNLTVEESYTEDKKVPFFILFISKKTNALSAVGRKAGNAVKSKETLESGLEDSEVKELEVEELLSGVDTTCPDSTDESIKKEQTSSMNNDRNNQQNKEFRMNLRPRKKIDRPDHLESFLSSADDKNGSDCKSICSGDLRKEGYRGDTAKKIGADVAAKTVLSEGDYIISDYKIFCEKLDAGLIVKRDIGDIFVGLKSEDNQATAVLESMEREHSETEKPINETCKEDDLNLLNQAVQLPAIATDKQNNKLDKVKNTCQNESLETVSSSEVQTKTGVMDNSIPIDGTDGEMRFENQNGHECKDLMVKNAKIVNKSLQDNVFQNVIDEHSYIVSKEVDAVQENQNKYTKTANEACCRVSDKELSCADLEVYDTEKDELGTFRKTTDILRDRIKADTTEAVIKTDQEVDAFHQMTEHVACEEIPVKGVCEHSDSVTSLKEENKQRHSELKESNDEEVERIKGKYTDSCEQGCKVNGKIVNAATVEFSGECNEQIQNVRCMSLKSGEDEINGPIESESNESVQNIEIETREVSRIEEIQSKPETSKLGKEAKSDEDEIFQTGVRQSGTDTPQTEKGSTYRIEMFTKEMGTNIKKYLVFMYVKDGPSPGFRVKKFQRGAENIFPELFLPDPQNPETKQRRIQFMIAASKYMDDLFKQHKEQKRQTEKTNVAKAYSIGKPENHVKADPKDKQEDDVFVVGKETKVTIEMEKEPICNSCDSPSNIIEKAVAKRNKKKKDSGVKITETPCNHVNKKQNFYVKYVSGKENEKSILENDINEVKDKKNGNLDENVNDAASKQEIIFDKESCEYSDEKSFKHCDRQRKGQKRKHIGEDKFGNRAKCKLHENMGQGEIKKCYSFRTRNHIMKESEDMKEQDSENVTDYRSGQSAKKKSNKKGNLKSIKVKKKFKIEKQINGFSEKGGRKSEEVVETQSIVSEHVRNETYLQTYSGDAKCLSGKSCVNSISNTSLQTQGKHSLKTRKPKKQRENEMLGSDKGDNKSVALYSYKKKKNAKDTKGSLIMPIKRNRQDNMMFKNQEFKLSDCFVHLKRIKLLDDAVLSS